MAEALEATKPEIMIPYINLHTHHHSQEDGVFLFNRRFGVDDPEFENTYFSAGIHPWDAALSFDEQKFEKVISHPNCLAVGECGLDTLKGPELSVQKRIFEYQLELALNHQKPLIIHCVKAFDDLIEICEPYHKQIPLIIHGFSKSVEMAQQLISNGFYLSLGTSILHKSNFDFFKLPLTKIFLETDDQEISIKANYKQLAGALKMEEALLKEKIYSNFIHLFKHYGR